MKKCECGCDKFYAKQIVRMDILVNGRGDFIENATDYPEDAENPYGPFECVVCGREYETLDDLP